jgi:hypothetical protein
MSEPPAWSTSPSLDPASAGDPNRRRALLCLSPQGVILPPGSRALLGAPDALGRGRLVGAGPNTPRGARLRCPAETRASFLLKEE